MTDTTHRDAHLFLTRVAEHPAPHTHAYVDDHGAVQACAAIRAGTVPAEVRQEISDPDTSIAEDLALLDTGPSFVTSDHPDWPRRQWSALDRPDRPFGLWARGTARLAEVTAHAVTITGARAASSYGTTVAADLAQTVARAGLTVITGGGYGIDEAALRGALAMGGRAVVVLPCGIDQEYPRANAQLFDDIVNAGGLLVSEYAPGRAPTRHRFAARARLLAALSAATVIVEAGKRSSAKKWLSWRTSAGDRCGACPDRSLRPLRKASTNSSNPAPRA